MPEPAPAPSNIRVHREAREFEFVWPDRTDRVPFRTLRLACPCAACVSENTGEALLDPDTVPDTIFPDGIGLAGNYALRVDWSDGHATGLYTWPHLRRIADSPSE